MPPVTGSATAVLDFTHSFVLTDPKSTRVVNLPAAVENALLVHLCDEFRSSHRGPGVKVVRELKQITDGREQPPVSVHVLERHELAPASVAIVSIGDSAILHYFVEIVPPLRFRHAERLEDPFLREVFKCLPGYSLNQHSLKVITGIGVRVVLAGRVVERTLAARDVDHVPVCMDPGCSRPASYPGDRSPVPESARVVQEVPYRDHLPVVGDFRQIVSNIVVERYLPVEC